MLVLEGLVGLHITFQVQFFSALLIRAQTSITVASNELPSRHQRSLEMNRDPSVIFESASKCCILGSFVDYEGYSISSKGFLPTVVDKMVNGG